MRPPRPDPLPHLAALALAQAEAGQPEASFRALDAALAATVGHRLCTIQIHYPGGQEAERVYSNHPALYPIGGRKAASAAPRMRELMASGRPVLVKSAAALRDSYRDHAGASSLGCGSAINMPVRWQGGTLGQVNLMHAEAWYEEADLPLVRSFAQFALPAFLLLARTA